MAWLPSADDAEAAVGLHAHIRLPEGAQCGDHVFQIGRKFAGVVCSVTGWGLYVALPNGSEGLVHISGLDDYYEFDKARSRLVGEATGNVFALGDRVRVRVERVNVPLGEINFQLVPPRAEDAEGPEP